MCAPLARVFGNKLQNLYCAPDRIRTSIIQLTRPELFEAQGQIHSWGYSSSHMDRTPASSHGYLVQEKSERAQRWHDQAAVRLVNVTLVVIPTVEPVFH
jgi:hypothetical protein